MSDRPDITPEDDATAAEYALGLLPADEARAFRARLALEPVLRGAVLDWERRFATLAEREIAEVPPPSGVEAQLMARLLRDAPPRRAAPWRWLTGLAFAALAALAVLVYTGGPERGTAELTARLAGAEDTLVLAASFDAETGRLALRREAGTVAEGRAQELWLIAGEAAPVSLGLLSPGQDTELVLPEALHPLLAGAVLAISDEPPGGSPTGAPTGAVLATGVVSEI
jgi:anti-sigma-K factor RskA